MSSSRDQNGPETTSGEIDRQNETDRQKDIDRQKELERKQKEAEAERKAEIDKLIDHATLGLDRLLSSYEETNFTVTGHIGPHIAAMCAEVDPRIRNIPKIRFKMIATMNALLEKADLKKINDLDEGLSVVDIAANADMVDILELFLIRSVTANVDIEKQSWFVKIMLRLDRILKKQTVDGPLENVPLTWIEKSQPEATGKGKEKEHEIKREGTPGQRSVNIPIRLGYMLPDVPFANVENIQSAWFHVPSGKIIVMMTIFRAIEGIVNRHADDDTFGPLFYFFRESFYPPTISPRNGLLPYRDPMYRTGTLGTSAEWNLSAVVFPCLVMTNMKNFKIRRAEAESASFRPLYGLGDAQIDQVHIERTLDEACYPSLPKSTLDDKNEDQVVTREAPPEWEKAVEDKPILVVNQLWLWNMGNVLLSGYTGGELPELPTKKNAQYDYGADLYYDSKEPDCKMPNFYSLHPSLDLQIGLIIANCVLAFGRYHLTNFAGVFLSTLDIFERAVIFKLLEVNNYLKDPGLRSGDIFEQKEKERLFIHSMSDINSELSMIKSVLNQQEGVLDKLLAGTKTKRELLRAWNDTDATGWRLVERARTRLDEYVKRIDKIQSDADRVEKTVDAMLNLKRTYASIEDARSSVVVGVAALAFAVITIIFTPLSFMASLFALPIDQIARYQTNGTSEATRDALVFTTSYIGKWFTTAEIVTLAITAGIVYLSFTAYLRSKKSNTKDHTKKGTRSTSEAMDKAMDQLDFMDTTFKEKVATIRSLRLPWRKAREESGSKA